VKSSTPFDQLTPSASLDDATALEYEDEVGVSYGRQSMRDNDEGVPRQPPLDRVGHVLLDQAVEGGGRFVENHDVRISQERSCERDALSLSPG
tara:strand:+ start:1833 stop:2111 length:279 start_codon:yes stop_codon:yes gene_type:complete